MQITSVLSKLLYKKIAKPIFFARDPESVHDSMVRLGSVFGRIGITRFLIKKSFSYSNPKLEQTILGIKFKNPIGLAAGFDKNAELTRIMGEVGFAFEEVGSITGNVCPGNPKPRLWRLPESEALVVYYGLKNDGCEVISKRLLKDLIRKKSDLVVGTSVAMTNCKENLDTDLAIKDYAKAFASLFDIGDYFTINISCPNTMGGQPFVDADKTDKLLNVIDQIQTNKPIFIKLSPDITVGQVDNLLDVAKKHRVHGIITTNLTKKRDNPKIKDSNVPNVGGISGKPVQEMSDDLISYIYKREGKRFVIIGCGGVFSAEDAYRKIRNGASLIQMITGMIYQGPQTIGEINRGLVNLLERDGLKNISEAVGMDVI